MNERLSSTEFQKRYGGVTDELIAESRPQIRMPKKRLPNKTEAAWGRQLLSRWKDYPDYEWGYEHITLLLPSGTRYTPDWMVVNRKTGCIIEFWEIKGGYIHPKGGSIRAFKEARSAFPFWSFRFAQLRKTEWTIANP